MGAKEVDMGPRAVKGGRVRGKFKQSKGRPHCCEESRKSGRGKKKCERGY
jgi:hypothetical protein